MGPPSKNKQRATKAANARYEQDDERVSREEIESNIQRLKRKKGQFITKEEVRDCHAAVYLGESHPPLPLVVQST